MPNEIEVEIIVTEYDKSMHKRPWISKVTKWELGADMEWERGDFSYGSLGFTGEVGQVFMYGCKTWSGEIVVKRWAVVSDKTSSGYEDLPSGSEAWQAWQAYSAVKKAELAEAEREEAEEKAKALALAASQPQPVTPPKPPWQPEPGSDDIFGPD